MLKRHQTKALKKKWKKLFTKTNLLTFSGKTHHIMRHIPNLAGDAHLLKEEALKPAIILPKIEHGIQLSIKQRDQKTKLINSETGKQIFKRI